MIQKRMDYAGVLGIEPEQIAEPTTIEEVVEAVRWAVGTNRSIVPWGAGTGQTYGFVPRRADVLLHLGGLNRIVEHQPGDLVITVEAGATLRQVQDALAAHNQYLPLDPTHSGTATVGGIIACDAWGPARAASGSARDWLIGLTVVDASGRLIKGGGKVVKNVTGYDLPKLHVGALGTLGVIVEATFKVAPRPDTSRALLLAGGGEALVQRIHAETTPAMSLLRTTSGGEVLALLYSGRLEAVDEQLQRAVTIANEEEALPTRLPPGMPPPLSETPDDATLVVRVGGLPSETYRRHRLLEEIGPWRLMDSYPSVGATDLYLRKSDPHAALAQVSAFAQDFRVPLTVLHAPLDLRGGGVPLWQPLPPSLPLLRRLKTTLDPDARLNPGRYVGGI